MKPTLFLLIMIPLFAQAQISDDFGDGNFTQNPVWWGNVDKFVVNTALQLQLNDTASGTAWIATSSRADTAMEWQCFVKAAFSPSSNNFIRIYLMSDETNLSKPMHGYFLQLGESGSKDALELYRQDGDKTVSICRGVNGEISSAFNIRIKIIRDGKGHWQLFSDTSGGTAFRQEASGTDDTYVSSSAFGFYCHYTSSNRTKIYFDDVYAGPVILDKTPPQLQNITVLSDSSLMLKFDESLLESVALQPQNYRLLSSANHPKHIELSGHSTEILLIFPTVFSNGITDTLEVSGLQDVAGNRMKTQKVPFTFYHPHAFDIVINEIMADPTPAVGLPEYEYIELWNQSRVNISLKNWQLQIGNSRKVFDEMILPAGDFLIVSRTEAANAFAGSGLFYGFNSLSLTNSGQQLKLLSPDGEIISRVSYTDSWYRDAGKSAGGWSLEQINPENVCSGAENWKASGNPSGGTPGKPNSVFSNLVFSPFMDHFQIPSNQTINLYFSQQMDEKSIGQPNAYKIIPENISPDSIQIIGQWPSAVGLHFPDTFDSSTVYKLQIKSSVNNCMSIPLQADTIISFGLPQQAGNRDIVINEVLFNPLAGGVDYVELYNRSDKIIDLGSLRLGNVKISPPAANDTLFYPVNRQQKLFMPHTYLLLTSSPEIVKNQYFTNNTKAFLRMKPFPNYGDKEGIVMLRQNNLLIDQFHYSEDMQYPLLNYKDGVALERISFDGVTNDKNNWHSASETVGFGTPGYKNSQFISDSATGNEIQIDPEIFSPDNDGYQDVLPIKYNFPEAGYTLTINIFNSSGQLIRQLVNNEYMGTKGMISWDGLMDNNTKAPVGIYILYIQIVDLKGTVKHYKKTAVLAGRIGN